MTANRIPLSDVLAHVAAEIRQAHAKATAEDRAVMKFQECEIELAVDIENSASGGLQVWVINLGGGVKRTDSNTVKVKYTALGSFVAEVKATSGSRRKIERRGKKVGEE